MKILIDITYISSASYAGIVVYAYRLLNGFLKLLMNKDIVLLVTSENRNLIQQLYPEFKLVCVSSKRENIILKLPHFKRFFYQKEIDDIIKSNKIDIILSPYITVNSIVTSSVPQIGVLHDVQTYILKKKQFIKRIIYRFFMNKVLNDLTEIVTISNYSKKSIKSIIPSVKTPVSVIYNSVTILESEHWEFLTTLKPYILNVNTLEPYKNLKTLIESFGIIKDKVPHNLVIKGKRLPYWDVVILPLIKKLELENRIILIDQKLDDAKLADLYVNAEIFVSPSLMEGFGFTPIEAAMYTIPVITTKEAALYETTMGLLNYYEPATDPMALANVILRIIQNKPQQSELENISKIFIEQYSIDKQAKQFNILLQKYL